MNDPDLVDVTINDEGQTLNELSTLFWTRNYGVEMIPKNYLIQAGELLIGHGHEVEGGGMNVAQNKFRRSLTNFIFGHSHVSQNYGANTLKDKQIGSWSVGSLCQRHPDWKPFNQWSNGFAIIEINSDGSFNVHNKKIVNNNVVNV
jgi:hypothetical protein